MRAGLTLIELVIAMAIFGVLSAMCFEGLIGVRRYGDLQRAQENLEVTGLHAIDAITAELANSAWTGGVSPATNLSTFPRVWKPADATRGNPPSFPFGETITYYKLRTEASITASPKTLHVEHVAFDDCSVGNRPTAMSQFATARPVTSLVLNGAFNDAIDPLPPIVSVVWESATPLTRDSNTAGTGGVNFQANLDLANLRRYRLTTIPDATTGTAILVKQWQNTGSAVDTDWPAASLTGATPNCIEVARNVVDVTFDTYLTETDTTTARLNPNQVRVDLVLAHTTANGGIVRVANGVARNASGGGAAILRRFSATISLRSVTDPTL